MEGLESGRKPASPKSFCCCYLLLCSFRYCFWSLFLYLFFHNLQPI